MTKVNFAEVEDLAALPRGTYHFAVTEGEVKQHGDEAKFPGNDFWSLELTVQDGEFQGRKQFVTIVLPPYTPYMLANILRATVGQHNFSEEDVQEGEFEVEIDDLINLEFTAQVRPQKNNPDFNQVSQVRPYDPDSWNVDESLLP